MAHFSVHVGTVRRGAGQNAIASAAYISRSKLSLTVTDKETNISVNLDWDYSKKEGLAHSKIYAPEHAPEWVLNREVLWNTVEKSENRCDAEVGGKIMIALPNRLSEEQNIALMEDIVSELVAMGMVVDANIHNDHENNPHLHLQHTQRELVENRYGEIEFSPINNATWRGPKWVKFVRAMAAEKINSHYLANGFDLQVTHKSYKELGIDLEPGRHEGPARNIKNAELVELNRQIAAANAEKIKAKPSIILDILAMNNPVFTKDQIAAELDKRLHAGIDFTKIEDIEQLQNEISATFTGLYEQLLVCPEISLVIETDLKGRTLYTTTKRIELEERFTGNIEVLHGSNRHGLNLKDSDLDHQSFIEKIVTKARDITTDVVGKVNEHTGLTLTEPKQPIALSVEQRAAVLNILNGNDISVLEGIPGAGKTTAMRELVRQYQKAGCKVIGVTPSSSASLELAKSTGIECRNASLWRKIWMEAAGKEFELILRGDYYKEKLYRDGSRGLTKNHVMIIDEASMGELANMDYLINQAKAVGAKVIFVGDRNQLSPVGWTGALGKAINICGSEKLEESRRQQNELHQEATKLLGRYRVREALDIFRQEGSIKVSATAAESNSECIKEFVKKYIEQSSALDRDDLVSTKTIAIGVFENKTRQLYNMMVRKQLKEAGVLKGQEYSFHVGAIKGEKQFLKLARGEQIVFSRNANHLGRGGIFNGELGTILKVRSPNPDGHGIIDILVHKASGNKEQVSLDLKELATSRWFNDGVCIEQGYAVTAHKLQGTSIDHVLVAIEKGIGFEVFNVLATRHRWNVSFYTNRELLESTFYEALDESADKAKNRFVIKDSNGEVDIDTILKGGLAKLVSKRTNTSFANDYRTMGQTSQDRIIKNYLDQREEAIVAIRKLSSWQQQTLRKTGIKPEMWDHKELWSEFKQAYDERAKAAKIITKNYDSYRDRLVQLSMNYATIEKHASQIKGSSQIDKVLVEQKTSILHEQDMFKELVQSVAAGQSLSIRKSLTDLNLHIAETMTAIEEKNILIAAHDDQRQELFDAVRGEEHFRDVLMPEYLSRIYHTFKGASRNAGVEALEIYHELVAKHGHEEATNMVIARPTILGDIRGWGLGRLVAFTGSRKDAIELVQNLGKQLRAFNMSEDMGIAYNEKLEHGNFGEKIFALEEEIEHLRSLLPADIDKEFIISVEEKLKTASNNIDWRELQYSKLFEAVKVAAMSKADNELLTGNSEEEAAHKAVVPVSVAAKDPKKDQIVERSTEEGVNAKAATLTNIATKESEKELLTEHSIEEGVTKDATITKIAASEPKQKKAREIRSGQKEVFLTFAQVKAGLNPSVVAEIFRHYAPHLNQDGKIQKRANQISSGSLSMDLGNKLGLWKRFSDGSKGDIFSFVEEATGCNKLESLEIVASHAGISVSSKSINFNQHQSKPSAAPEEQIQNFEPKNEWVAHELVPKEANAFNPKADLVFLSKSGSKIIETYEYKNKDNQLLGYGVRVEDKDGKKQVLPVAYCYNEAHEQSKWALKGFSDNGTKPIYGLEKLIQNSDKPILIVEGEKTTDAATRLLPNYAVISWMGGAQSVDRVDWSKLANRIVVIWPDNDIPGIEAAGRIAGHIDNHNGFTGLVSIVDTKSLNLPQKWDLADALPNHLAKEQLDEIVVKSGISSSQGLGVFNHKVTNQGKQRAIVILDSINILIASGRLDKDEYISKEMYHDTVVAIAKVKNIDLTKSENFIEDIRSVQDEYRKLHKEYAIFNQNQANEALEAGEQTKNDLVRDTCVLHQVQFGISKLTKIHKEYIENTAKEEIAKMKQFTASDKEHAGSNMYKTITSNDWLETLADKNQQQTNAIKLKFTAKTIDEFLVDKSPATKISQEHLSQIRKYGIDEHEILKSFKTDQTLGEEQLASIYGQLTKAQGFATDYKAIIEEARQWNYSHDDITGTKAIMGMDDNEAKNHYMTIRADYLKQYLDINVGDFKSAKQNAQEFEGLKEIVFKEQEFLKKTFEGIKGNINYYNCDQVTCSAIHSGQQASMNPEIMSKALDLAQVMIKNKVAKPLDTMEHFKVQHRPSGILRALERRYEAYNVYDIPKQHLDSRGHAKNSEEIFAAIEKEQNCLADLHGNIKYIIFDKELLAKCALAHEQRENGDLAKLKAIAKISLVRGAKTEGSLIGELQQTTDLKETHRKLDQDIEVHHINSNLEAIGKEKQEARTTDQAIDAIKKEQEFLAQLHGNLKYPELDLNITAKTKLANELKQEGLYDGLQSLAKTALSTGAKTEESLVKELQQTTDLKGTHKKLDQDIETHHINSNLEAIGKEKQEAMTPQEAIDTIKKEQKFLAQLHGTLQHPEHHGQILALSIQNAMKNEQDNVIGQLHKLSSFVQSRNFKTHDEMTKILKDNSDPSQAHNTLLQAYQEQFVKTIHKGLGMIAKGETVKVDNNTMSCPVKFMEHLVKTRTNEFIPHHEIKQIQNKVIRQQKHLEMEKDMGDFSM